MKYFVFVLLIVFATGCSVFENEETIPSKMIGEWEWTLTSGGWNHPVSADTANYSMTLIIHSQNEAELFRDDKLVTEYQITNGEKGWKDGSLLLRPNLKSQCAASRVRYIPENDGLTVDAANCVDLPTDYFKRVAH